MSSKIFPLKVNFENPSLSILQRILNNNICVDWTEEEAQMPEANTHLWEESWDDDDTSEEFLAQLKYVSVSYSQLVIIVFEI